MSFRQRHTTIGRGLWLLGLGGALLIAVVLAPSGALGASAAARGGRSELRAGQAAAGTPTQVIDAQTDPQAAAAAINTGCTDLSNCSWSGSNVTFAYGPSQIYGDVLYNCSDPATEPDATANTAAGFSETRSESVSLSETVSLKISLGFLGFEKASAEFRATFGQSQSFSQAVTTSDSVEVPPGYKGWIETQVLSGIVTGDAYITDGINKLIQVTNLGMSFPLENPASQDPGDNRAPTIYNTFSMPMTSQDYSTRCGPINGLGAVRSQALSDSFTITVCAARAGVGGCTTRDVAGAAAPPADIRGTAVLDRDGRRYATGTEDNGDVRLDARGPIAAGDYTLTIHERLPGHNGRRRTLTTSTMVIPIAIR